MTTITDAKQPRDHPDMFAWVIEMGGSKVSDPLYFSGMDTFGRFRWSRDHELAVRFSRKRDADAVAAGDTLGTNHRVAEHGWHSGGAETPAGGATGAGGITTVAVAGVDRNEPSTGSTGA